MADLQPTDLFLVNRSDSTETVAQADLMAQLQDTDLMLVNRADQTYKITGEDLKDSLKPELTLAVVVAPSDPVYVGSTLTATPVGNGGTPPYTFTYQWYQKLGVIVGWTAIADATANTYQIPSTQTGWQFKCAVELTDADGDTINADSNATQPAEAVAIPPTIQNVSLTAQTPDTEERFTSQKFDFAVACANTATTPIDYFAKAKVSGDLNKMLRTDEIIGVESTAYSNGAVSGTPSPTAGEGDWSNAFNGSLTGTPTACGVGATYTLTLDNSIPVSGKTVEAYLGGEGDKKFIYCNGADSQKVGGANNGGEWITLTVSSIGGNDINSISIVSTGSGTTQLYALRVAGEILIDGQPILTFDGDKDLDLFTAGDVVRQDSGYTVNTSEITGTGSVTYSSLVSGPAGGWQVSYPLSNLFDGDTSTVASSQNTDVTMTFNLGFTGGGPYNVEIQQVSQGCTLTIDGVEGTKGSPDPAVVSWSNLSSVNNIVWNAVSPNRVGGAYIKINGGILKDGSSTLTLDDATELSNLRPGDFITQENSTGTPIYSKNFTYEGAGAEAAIANPANMWDGNYTTTRTTYETNGTPGAKLVYDLSSTPITTTGQIQVVFNGGFGGARGWQWNDEAPVFPTYNSATITTDVRACPETITKLTIIDGGSNPASAGIFGIKQADGTPIVDGTGPEPSGIVGSIDGSTITLSESNGTWGPANDDHYVVAQLEPGTAKFGSAGTNSMTLTDNDDSPNVRWIPGEGKIAVGPSKVVDDATLWLKFNANGDGTLVSPYLVDEEPNWTEFAGDLDATNAAWTISFPATFADQQTPDDDLPYPTTLCVQAKTVNDAGSSPQAGEPVKQACVTPKAQIGPNATMYGLRLDMDRDTYLQNSCTFNGTWTFSAWIKLNALAGNNGFLISSGSGGYGINIGYASNDLRYWDGASHHSLSGPLSNNVWQHVVITCKDNVVTGYVNGIQTGQNAIAGGSGNLVNTFIGKLAENKYNGYMSDLYMVDGNGDLDPTTFGKEYENNWGPLNSPVVEENVGNFGPSGFYLPFDPAATGQTLDLACVFAYVDATSSPLYCFNPDLTLNSTATTNSQTITFADASFAGKTVEVWTADLDSKGRTITLTGNPETSISDKTQFYWLNIGTVPAGGQVEIRTNASSSFFVSIAAIKVDGKEIFYYNNIGVDDSGNDNNFSDSGFAVGNTSQVWSKYLESETGAFAVNNEPYKAFNGDYGNNNQCEPSAPGYKLIFTPPGGIQYTDTVEVISGGSDKSVQINGGGVVQTGAANAYSTVSTGGGTLNTLAIFKSGDWPTLKGIRIDGEVLIDANIQDTVLDTPMLDYSMLTAGKNGNLVGDSSVTTGAITYIGKPGTNYYFEVDGESAILQGGGVSGTGDPYVVYPFTATDGKVYNFGQQPFANEYNTSQVWSKDVTADSDFTLPASNAFDGNLTTNCKIFQTGNPIQIVFPTPISDVTLVEVYRSSGNENNSVRYNNQGSGDAINFPDSQWTTVYSGAAIDLVNVIVSSPNDQPGCAAIRVNGKILLDPVNNSQKWSDQTTLSSNFTFDGNLTGTGNTTPAGQTNVLTLDPAIDGQVVTFYGANGTSITVNGSTSGATTGGSFTPLSLDLGSSESISTITMNPGDISGLAIDGVLLLDPGYGGIAGALGNELKQTWLEWNNVVTLMADNPEDVALFEQLKAQLEAYQGNVQEARQQLINDIYESDLPAADQNELIALLNL